MGLLTNPNTMNGNAIVNFVKTKHVKIGIISYVAGLIWFAFLSNADYNQGTYFSENALLPGLVVENYRDNSQSYFYNRLIELEEDVKGKRIQPETFAALLKDVGGIYEIGLQNYTLTDPVTKAVVTGTNVFGILRAKRAAGTEAIVLNAPYFPLNAQRKNLPAIATMLSLAQYFQKQVYWAKDIVFLMADSHIGTLAWVKGHQEIHESNNYLSYEPIHLKTGNIQAAINVIIEDNLFCSLSTKFHGINGQLPNLDLVNLLNKFIVQPHEKKADWEQDFWKLISYMGTQATGSTTGSHGFFLKYGIESVTLYGHKGKNCKDKSAISYSRLGRILEASFRSLNNLLERLHQSFFFYLKTTPNRFISIGLYYGPIALLLLPILVKGTAIWLKEEELEATRAILLLIAAQTLAVILRRALSAVHFVWEFEMNPKNFLHLVLLAGGIQLIGSQLLFYSQRVGVRKAVLCFLLLQLGTGLYSLALFNPSLVAFFGTVATPLLFYWQTLDKQKPWVLFTFLGIIVAIVAVAYDELEAPLNKAFYEAELFGNFLFDFVFTFVFPIFSTLLAIK